MSISNENNQHVMRVPLGAITASTVLHVARLVKTMRVTSFQLVDPTGVAAHASNTVLVELKRGSTVIADFSNDSGGANEALVANTWQEFLAAAADLDKDENLTIEITIAASGALHAGSVAMIGLHQK